MEYENTRVMELKALARGLRSYSPMRKAELVALLQNNPPPGQSRASTAPTAHTRPPHLNRPPPPPQRHAAYVTLQFDDNGCCKIIISCKEVFTSLKYFGNQVRGRNQLRCL